MKTGKWVGDNYVFMALSLLALGMPVATAQVVETHNFNAFNRVIPDGNASGLSDLRVVSSAIAELSKVRVSLRIQGEFNGDLYGYLRHVGPGGTNFCVLLNRPGKTTGDAAGYDDVGFDITLDHAAVNGDVHRYREILVPALGQPVTGSWQPDGRRVDPAAVSETSPRTTTLSSFAGVPASGDWTLFLADLESGGTNFIVGWGLEFSGMSVPQVNWPIPAPIVYGTGLGAPQLNASSPVQGAFVYNPPAGTILNAGQGQILSVTFTPADSLSYATVTTNVAIEVSRKALTITANDVSRVYGGPPEALTASYSGFVNSDTASNLDNPATVGTDATPVSPVGTYPIIVGGASDANYAISFIPGTLTITRAATVGTLASSPNPAVPGQTVAFTFTVSAVAPSSAAPVGAVLFSIDGTSTSAPLVNGVATLTTSSLSVGWHTVTGEYQGTPNFSGTAIERLDQLINTQPIAGTDEIPRIPPYGAKVKIASLLSNDSELDGDLLAFVGFSATSQNGGTISREADWISYSAPSGFTNDDSFTYTISDGRGQPVVGTVNVRVQSNPLPSPNLSVTDLGDGSYRIRFDGIPGLTYRIEGTGSLSPANWQTLGIETANPSGNFEITDRPAVGFGQRFYRSVHP